MIQQLEENVLITCTDNTTPRGAANTLEDGVKKNLEKLEDMIEPFYSVQARPKLEDTDIGEDPEAIRYKRAGMQAAKGKFEGTRAV